MSGGHPSNGNSGNEDLYVDLGVARDVSEKEITKAYRKKAQQYHPDKTTATDGTLKESWASSNPGVTKAQADELFRKAGRAHEILTDPRKRRIYDLTGKVWLAELTVAGIWSRCKKFLWLPGRLPYWLGIMKGFVARESAPAEPSYPTLPPQEQYAPIYADDPYMQRMPSYNDDRLEPSDPDMPDYLFRDVDPNSLSAQSMPSAVDLRGSVQDMIPGLALASFTLAVVRLVFMDVPCFQKSVQRLREPLIHV